jgi:hypothetical protein
VFCAQAACVVSVVGSKCRYRMPSAAVVESARELSGSIPESSMRGGFCWLVCNWQTQPRGDSVVTGRRLAFLRCRLRVSSADHSREHVTEVMYSTGRAPRIITILQRGFVHGRSHAWNSLAVCLQHGSRPVQDASLVRPTSSDKASIRVT